MSVWRGCGGAGRFHHWDKEGGSRERWRVQKDAGSETKASDAHIALAPSGDTAKRTTLASVKLFASSASEAAADSSRTQTITVGPDPDRVAPRAPAGSAARTALRSGALPER